MKERLNNDQITRRIMDTNSDLKRYLNLAPSVNIIPPKPITTSRGPKTSIPPAPFPRPTLRP